MGLEADEDLGAKMPEKDMWGDIVDRSPYWAVIAK